MCKTSTKAAALKALENTKKLSDIDSYGWASDHVLERQETVPISSEMKFSSLVLSGPVFVNEYFQEGN